MKSKIKTLFAILSICVCTTLGAVVAGAHMNLVPNLSTTLTVVKAVPVNLGGYNFSNPNAAIIYIQVFDAAATGAITLGTTTPIASIAIPAYGVTDSGPTFTGGFAFLTGIVVAATTTPTGNTAPTTAINANFYTN